MSLKHVNAVVVGSGAGGGVVAKELAEAGLDVVVLERGRWVTPDEERKDDLRNQRTTALGVPYGPDEEKEPRVFVDAQGHAQVVWPADGPYNNNAACVGGGTLSYGAMAWRYMAQDFRMKSLYGAPAGSTLEDCRRSERRSLQGPAPPAAAHAAFARFQGNAGAEARGAATGLASVLHPDAPQYGPVQRAGGMHAMPLVLRLRLRMQCQMRHPEYGHSDGARHRAL
jgi:choline dehydrogenase-like flavoprotein